MSKSSEKREPLLSVIIPTYNRRPILLETLEHLHQHLPEGVEVLVVDDGSTYDTAEAVCRRFPSVRVLVQPRRLGPAEARNVGLDQAKGRYFLPLDSDCFVVPATLLWLVEILEASQTERHFLLPCRSWPEGHRSVERPEERVYTARDILLKSYGEVVPVLPLASLRRHRLRYPSLFAGGEPLMVLEVSLRERLDFVDRLILEYRTDIAMRISSGEYQLAHAEEIARVFEAYLPYLTDSADAALSRERARTLEKAGVYLALGGRIGEARKRLWQAWRNGRTTALMFLLATVMPAGLWRGGFAVVRRWQDGRRRRISAL